MRSRSLAVLAAAATLVALAACGGDDDSAPAGPADLTVTALDVLTFDADAYDLAAGAQVIEYENDGSLVHTLLIEDVAGFKLSVSGPGNTDRDEVTLEAGTYTLYCDVSGHRAGGMEATLTVE